MTKPIIHMLILATAATAFTGCVRSHRGGVVATTSPAVVYPSTTTRTVVVPRTTERVVVHEAPPAPRREVYGEPPDSRHIWVPGYWARSNDRWVWIAGHWEARPRVNAIWVPGQWEKNLDGKGWTWTPGHWE